MEIEKICPKLRNCPKLPQVLLTGACYGWVQWLTLLHILPQFVSIHTIVFVL